MWYTMGVGGDKQMDALNKFEAKYYKERCEKAEQDLSQLNYQIGWIRSSLNRLGELIASGDVTVSKYHKGEVERIVKAIEESEKSAKDLLTK